MQTVIPAFRITDYPRSRAFYVDGMGFQIDWVHRFEPHFPVFVQLTRDGMTIYLSEHRGDCQVGGLIHLFVPDVDAWYSELHGRPEIGPLPPPHEDIPGLRMMTVVDPDGNQVRIATRMPQASSSPEYTSG